MLGGKIIEALIQGSCVQIDKQTHKNLTKVIRSRSLLSVFLELSAPIITALLVKLATVIECILYFRPGTEGWVPSRRRR